jgi:hypothetical protein
MFDELLKDFADGLAVFEDALVHRSELEDETLVTLPACDLAEEQPESDSIAGLDETLFTDQDDGTFVRLRER